MHFISSLAQVKQKKIVKNYTINRTEKKKEKNLLKIWLITLFSTHKIPFTFFNVTTKQHYSVQVYMYGTVVTINVAYIHTTTGPQTQSCTCIAKFINSLLHPLLFHAPHQSCRPTNYKHYQSFKTPAVWSGVRPFLLWLSQMLPQQSRR